MLLLFKLCVMVMIGCVVGAYLYKALIYFYFIRRERIILLVISLLILLFGKLCSMLIM